MADPIKISGLPAASSANASDVLPATQAGVTRRVTLAQIRTYIQSIISIAQSQVSGLGAALDGKEPALGNPLSDGQVLVSTATGARSWATRTLPPLALYWTANGDIYFVTHQAMTLAASPQEAGIGTLTYFKAIAAAPTSFSSVSLPIALAQGDVLKVTCASISGYKTVTLSRSA